jgi:hypothetical protein
MTRPLDGLEEDWHVIEDDDGGTESDGDICEGCEWPRSEHKRGGRGCDRFVEA